MLRIAFWAFNIWSVKKGFDLLKENVELKQQVSDSGAAIRALTSLVPEEKDPS